MRKEITYYRDLEDVYIDLLWPGGGLGWQPSYDSVRYAAIAEVLRRIPPEDYAKLREAQFRWFIPWYETYGGVFPFYATHEEQPLSGELSLAPYSRVLYLSPRLEEAAWSVAVGAVAHELAHIALDHSLECGSQELYDAQEEEAFALTCRWGFEEEAKRHRAVFRRRETLEANAVKKYLEAAGRSA